MSGAVNDNDRPITWASQIRPLDESAPSADTIGMEVQTPLTEERMALALETLDDGLSVLVLGVSQEEASNAAWEIIKAMAPKEASR